MTVSRIGYYGKLPARADFVGRRLPDDFIKHWDGWLQAALSLGEAAGSERWRQHFLASPTWRFALPAGVCGHGGWIGALRPSMDAVGRCFPFVLAVELPTPVDIVTLVDAGTGWFATLEAAAGAIARPDFELDWLDRPLPSLGPSLGPSQRLAAGGGAPVWPSVDASEPSGLWYGLPSVLAVAAALRRQPAVGPLASIWWTAGTPGFDPGVALTRGLVPPDAFAALVDGSWEKHGWKVEGGAAHSDNLADFPLEWDRLA
jgi:type VI secretion system protein ImpM